MNANHGSVRKILIQPSFFSLFLSPIEFSSLFNLLPPNSLLPLPHFFRLIPPRDLLSGAVWTKTVSFSDLIHFPAVFHHAGDSLYCTITAA